MMHDLDIGISHDKYLDHYWLSHRMMNVCTMIRQLDGYKTVSGGMVLNGNRWRD